MTYVWDITKWIVRLLIGFLRKDRQKAWLKVLLSPVKELHDDFLAVNEEIDFKSKYNSQQRRFAVLLNKLFDPVLKRIRVVTGSDALPVLYAYYKSEGKPKRYIWFKSENMPKSYIYFKSEYQVKGIFIVYVPTSLQAQEAQIRSWVEYYKLSGKSYIIKWI